MRFKHGLVFCAVMQALISGSSFAGGKGKNIIPPEVLETTLIDSMEIDETACMSLVCQEWNDCFRRYKGYKAEWFFCNSLNAISELIIEITKLPNHDGQINQKSRNLREKIGSELSTLSYNLERFVTTSWLRVPYTLNFELINITAHDKEIFIQRIKPRVNQILRKASALEYYSAIAQNILIDQDLLKDLSQNINYSKTDIYLALTKINKTDSNTLASIFDDKDFWSDKDSPVSILQYLAMHPHFDSSRVAELHQRIIEKVDVKSDISPLYTVAEDSRIPLKHAQFLVELLKTQKHNRKIHILSGLLSNTGKQLFVIHGDLIEKASTTLKEIPLKGFLDRSNIFSGFGSASDAASLMMAFPKSAQAKLFSDLFEHYESLKEPLLKPCAYFFSQLDPMKVSPGALGMILDWLHVQKLNENSENEALSGFYAKLLSEDSSLPKDKFELILKDVQTWKDPSMRLAILYLAANTAIAKPGNVPLLDQMVSEVEDLKARELINLRFEKKLYGMPMMEGLLQMLPMSAIEKVFYVQ